MKRFTKILAIIIGAAYAFTVLSAFQVFHNQYSQKVAAAPILFHAIAGFCLFLTVSLGIDFYKLAVKRESPNVASIAGISCIVFAILTFIIFPGLFFNW